MSSSHSTAPRLESEIGSWDTEVDVLVVGLGCAGACAALEARAAGADVLVLERAGGGGGTSANSGGLIYLGGGTPVQEACGFDDSPEEMYRFLIAASGPGAQEDKIRKLCDESVSHFHWLVEQGVPFKSSFYPEPGMEAPTDDCLVFSGGEHCHPFNRIAQPAPRAHKPQVPGAGGAFLMQCLVAATERSGARIETDTRALALVEDTSGRNIGLVAQTAGQQRTFRARRGIVLAGGGFVWNPELVALHAPQIARCKAKNGQAGDDGHVMRMGQAVGGNIVRMETGEVALPVTIPNRLSRGLFLNRTGQRFINEDTYFGHIGQASLQHQDGQVYFLLDDATFERNLLQMEPTFVADTLEDLESEAGFPPGSLVQSVSFYNQHARAGNDPLFHKRSEALVPLETPPYAILDCRPEHCLYAGFTTGGLQTAPGGEVLGVEGEPLPGLYAAGRTAALLSGSYYPASGISLADGTFFGRYAGRSAASNRD